MPSCLLAVKIIWKHSLCPNWKWAKRSHKLLTWVTNFSVDWLKSPKSQCETELAIAAPLLALWSSLLELNCPDWLKYEHLSPGGGGYSRLDTFGKGAWGEWQAKQQHQVFINWEALHTHKNGVYNFRQQKWIYVHGGGGTLLPLIEVCLGDSIMGCNFFWDWTPKQKMTDTSLRLSRRVFGWESCGAIHVMVVGKISCNSIGWG